MKAKWLVNGLHAVNWTVLLGGLQGAFPPDIVQNKWFLLAQMILATVLPSIGGVGHKVMFGTNQTPMIPPK